MQQGQPQHLEYHQNRVAATAADHGFAAPQLQSAFSDCKHEGRAKVVYDENGIRDVETSSYAFSPIRCVTPVTARIEYAYKYCDRSAIDALKQGRDEILMVTNNMVTDTSIANVAFYDGRVWHTPKTPLLQGTQRARLLDQKRLQPADIALDDLQNFQKMAVMNALAGFVILPKFQIKKENGCILTL
ncbi:MAG: aminotransferase class IV [Campylobacterota bacterium]